MRFFMKRAFPFLLITILLALAGCQQQQPASGQQADAGMKPPASASEPSTGADGAKMGEGADSSGAPSGATPPAGDNAGAQPSDSSLADVHMDRVTALRLADPRSGWSGGDGWIARTDDGGKTWNVQATVPGTVAQLFALNGKLAWAVVDPSDHTSGRILYATTDGGAHWAETGTVPNDGFLHFRSLTEAYSANAKTTDGGKTWTTLPIPQQTVGDAYFHDAANGWIVASVKDSIVVQRTEDGGLSWKTVMTRKTVASLNGAVIRSAGTNDAWVELIGESGMTQTSYSLFHTTDGGQHWQTVLANSTAGGGPAPGFGIDYSDGPTNAGSRPGALYVVDPNVAFMGGQCPACDKPNTIGWTTDGGKTWTNGEQSLPGYGDQLLAMADDKQGWWVINDSEQPAVMYTTADGGRSWKKVHTFDPPKPAK
jgi:photosystem II stability/assembly factor-like uncharacterized protein